MDSSKLKEKKVFCSYYSDMYNVVDVADLLSHFVSEHVIDFSQKNQFLSSHFGIDLRLVDQLVEHIVESLQAGTTERFYSMLRVFEVHGDVVTQELAKRMRESLSTANYQGLCVCITVVYNLMV